MNPLGQVPAVTLPDGSILTESLAIANYLHDLAPQAGLVPPPGDATRAMFHRWIALVCAIYPTFTYGDEPVKWVKDKAGEG